MLWEGMEWVPAFKEKLEKLEAKFSMYKNQFF
jgi:hypothetical protein